MKKVLWILAGVLVIGFLIYRDNNDEHVEMFDGFKRNQVNHIEIYDRDSNDEMPSTQLGHDDDVNDIESDLREQIETFINLYYDWNYAGLTGLHLHDFVSDHFFDNVASELAHYEQVHSHDHGDEYFVVSEATADIMDLVIFTMFEENESNDIDVIVTFDVFYDIPGQDPFDRNVVVWLELSRDDLSVNNKRVMN